MLFQEIVGMLGPQLHQSWNRPLTYVHVSIQDSILINRCGVVQLYIISIICEDKAVWVAGRLWRFSYPTDSSYGIFTSLNFIML